MPSAQRRERPASQAGRRERPTTEAQGIEDRRLRAGRGRVIEVGDEGPEERVALAFREIRQHPNGRIC
jgi:hypothetical protein